MEYLSNGEFLEDLEQSAWQVTRPVERVGDVGTGSRGNFAQFSPGGRLHQPFTLATPKPKAISFSMGIRASGGDDTANGNAQLILMLQGTSALPAYYTFRIKEFGTWQTSSFSLNLPETIDHGEVHLLLLGNSTIENISMRHVSLTGVDQTQGKKGEVWVEKNVKLESISPNRPDVLK